MQAQLAPPPQNVFRRPRPLFTLKILDLALVKLRDDFLAEVGDRSGTSDDAVDTRAVGARIALAQMLGEPWVTPFHVAQEAREAAAGEVSAREQCILRPGRQLLSQRIHQHIDGGLRELS